MTKREQRLGSLCGRPRFDPAPFVIPILEAMFEGPFLRVQTPEREFTTEQDQMHRLVPESYRFAERFEAGEPGDRRAVPEGNRTEEADMRAIEKEVEARQATSEPTGALDARVG
jgi:hypothetical protein